MEVSFGLQGGILQSDRASCSAFAGLAVMIICLPLPMYIGRAMARVQSEKMESVRIRIWMIGAEAQDLLSRPINGYNS